MPQKFYFRQRWPNATAAKSEHLFNVRIAPEIYVSMIFLPNIITIFRMVRLSIRILIQISIGCEDFLFCEYF
jgi:hypothetical protein